MVKTPRTRHSKTRKQPVTLDLKAADAGKQDGGDAAKPKPGSKPEAAAGAAPEKTETAKSGSGENRAASVPPVGRTGSEKSDNGKNAGQPKTGGTGGPSKPAETEAPPRRSSIGLVSAGIIGGLIVLGGGAAAMWSGLLPAGTAPESASGDLDTLRQEIETLKSRADTDSEAARAAAAEVVAGAESRIEAALSEIETLKADVVALRDAVQSGEARDGPGLETLGARLDELEAKLADLSEAGTGEVSTEGMAALDERIARLEETVRAATDGIEAVKKAADSNAEKLSALDEAMTVLSKRMDEEGSRPEVALAIAAAGLKSAIDRGLPFMTELETYAAVAPDTPEIADLRNLAAKGVPTRAAIGANVADAADRMVAAVKTTDPDQSFFERLVDSAQSLVEVRPIGAVEGDDPAAIVARMEVAIKSNDYATAIAEYETLPDAARAAGEAFMADVRARMQVDALVDKALAGALRPAG